MPDDYCAQASVSVEVKENGTSSTRQRKKRKWDQPAESLISAGLTIPRVMQAGSITSSTGVASATPLSAGFLTNALPGTGASVSLQVPALQQHAAVIVEKINQPKIQDEVIAREIIINDAEPTIRYRLTKRQTQEEIQRNSGAVVITRGKFRPPNGLPDNERPLYLHISAGAQLKDTAERIKAVDRAAAMVEEILKQGQILQPATHQLTACVFLGFEPDPSLNIISRIRGPNDQYINHIMHETGATVALRGWNSGNIHAPDTEDTQQALHLYLSSNTQKSLEAAKLLAENLLDTISVECGVSRAASKVYGAVPPPQLLTVVTTVSTNEQKVGVAPSPILTMSVAGPSSMPTVMPTYASAFVPASLPSTCSEVNSVHPGAPLTYGLPHTNTAVYQLQTLSRGTSYSGYGGIYPQATPLQQVALALRQASSPASSAVLSTTDVATIPKTSSISTSLIAESDKRSQAKRKFQELPALSKGPTSICQNVPSGEEMVDDSENLSRRDAFMPPPRKLIGTCSSKLLGSPCMPPPPPKFTAPSTPELRSALPQQPKVTLLTQASLKETNEILSDTLRKLGEYGDDDDSEETSEDFQVNNLRLTSAAKPFWAA